METPSRHSYDLDGATRVFPIASPIKGDNYCRVEVDGVYITDRSKYDIVNNSIVFVNLADVPNGSQLDVLVVQSEEAIGLLGTTTNVDTVATNIDDVNTVANNIANVNTVAGNDANVTTVAGINANVTTVAGIASNVTTVANNNANVTTVASNTANINTVASNITDVNTVATNINDVTNFADVYLGGKTADPTTRNDGSALQAGDLYLNTSVGELRAYSGTSWVAGVTGTMAVQQFNGDGVTSTFTLSTAPSGENNTQVYVNGIYQQKDTYSVLGTSLILSEAPEADQTVEVVTVSILALGETDASLVSYTSSKTGATERTVKSKLGDMVSVKDFGAVGDGVTDDTAAIQDAIDANLGGTIYIPKGTYKITSTLLQDTTGLGDTTVCNFIGEGMQVTVIDNQAGASAFKVTSGTGVEFAYNFGLRNLTITSTNNTANTIGVELVGARFVTLDNIKIEGLGSHGVYGASSVGDFTDTAHVDMNQIQIQNCGGYGVYAKTDGNAIQYQWNMYQCRVGVNTLGGILLESMTNSEIKNCGIYYNNNFGLKITTGTSGAPAPKLITVEGCEFDNNEGVQLDVETGAAYSFTSLYLIDNNLTPSFTKGIELGATSSVIISQVYPRMNQAVTGKVIVEIGAACVDTVIRDSSYQGWSSSNGTFYVDNTIGQVTIDDRNNRHSQYNGTYLVEVKNTGKTATSPTTKTGYYAVNGELVTVSFRNLNGIDTSVFSGSDLIGPTLPFQCKIADVGFVGSCIITNDAGISNGAPIPNTGNSADMAIFLRAGSGALLTASHLTSGVSSITNFTLNYIKE